MDGDPMEHPESRVLMQTEGGRNVFEILTNGQSQDDASDTALRHGAIRETLQNAHGAVLVLLGDAGDVREQFLSEELPLLLKNEQIVAINDLPRVALTQLYPEGGTKEELAAAQKKIIHCLKTRSIEIPKHELPGHARSQALLELERFLEAKYGQEVYALTGQVLRAQKGLSDAAPTTKALQFERENPGLLRRVLAVANLGLRRREREHQEKLSTLSSERDSATKALEVIRREALSDAGIGEAAAHLASKGYHVGALFKEAAERVMRAQIHETLERLSLQAKLNQQFRTTLKPPEPPRAKL